MSFWTPADLAQFQGMALSAMTTPCTITRATNTSDGSGGTTQAWTVISPPGLLCRVVMERQPGIEGVVDGRLESKRQWLVHLPAGTDVTPPDRILALGKTYEVDTVAGPLSNEAQRIAYCWVLE